MHGANLATHSVCIAITTLYRKYTVTYVVLVRVLIIGRSWILSWTSARPHTDKDRALQWQPDELDGTYVRVLLVLRQSTL